MPITEIIVPLLKQDEETRQAFKTVIIPGLLSLIGRVSGSKSVTYGSIVLENNTNVEDAVKYAVGIEWEEAENFYTLVGSDDFKDFAAKIIKPFATGPAKPQLYETDLPASEVFGSPCFEVYRINAATEEGLAKAKEAWAWYVTAIRNRAATIHALNGTSLNLDESLFLGVIGWEGPNDAGVEARKTLLENEAVKKAKAALESLHGFDSILVKRI